MCIFRYIISFVLLFQWTTTSCHGQYYFKHYQVDDGLVHNAAMSIIQDKKGLIWIGTRGGLSRFDGYTFKSYKNENNKLGNIGNDILVCVTEDKKGMIWIGSGRGVFRFDPYLERFKELENAPKVYISHLEVDNNNNLWFLANGALYKYDQSGKQLEKLKIHGSCMALDQHMNIWTGDDDGVLNVYNPLQKTSKTIRLIEKKIPEHLRSISKIYPISDSELLIGCFKLGLKRYNINTGSVKSLPLRSAENTIVYVRDIIAAGNDQYWIATESGIFIYNLNTNASTHLRKRNGDPYSIADNAVYTFCKDNQGGMWVGTYFGGLNYFSKQNARFEKYYPLPGTNSISGDAVAEIVSDKNENLWIGTEDAGINKLDLRTGNFTYYTAGGKKGDVSYPNIHGLLAFGDQLYIGPFFSGLEIMNMQTGQVTDRFRSVGAKDARISSFISRIYLTKDSSILIGTSYYGAGLFKYDPRSKTFSRINQIPYGPYVYNILEDHEGTIWTGTATQGTFFYNPKTGIHGNLLLGDSLNNPVDNEFAVHYIFEDSNHEIWFATSGGGLIKLSRDRKTIKRFTMENGLPTNVVYCILEDNAKHLWISSLKGLICLNLSTETLKIYTQANGLITDQFNYNSAYKHTDGKMYFGSVKGMIAFNPSSFDQKEPSPPTYITGFQINNKEAVPDTTSGPLYKSILYTDTITLNYNQNNFSIEFAAINFSSPEVTRYKYQMKGLDRSWTYLNTNRNAYFTDLAPGDYEFSVQAESNVGSWAGNERRLFIKILPPFWRSDIAYLFYFIAFAAIVYFLMRYYRRYLEGKNLRKLKLFELEKEKEIYQAKIEFFTNITHEIQTPLTLIAGPIEWLIKKFRDRPDVNKSLLIAEKNSKRLVELTGQLLDFRKTEADQFSLNFVNTDIAALVTDLAAGFKEQAGRNNIKLDVILPPDHFKAFVDREAFIKICTNLLSNGIKYADTHTIVNIDAVNSTDAFFTIRFTNDGKGIPDEYRSQLFKPFFRMKGNNKPGTGIGLSLAKSLTELHNGSLQLISGEPDSIIFELRLPIHQKFEFQLSSWKKIK
ncbi:histidine kinase [Niabella sp. 3A5MI-3]|nr:histidine kinase [Niabella beijingensis]